ncbi:MAG: GNAT family N-acetyltransferase [Pseudomonadota bacterium]
MIPWTHTPSNGQEQIAALAATVPVLETDRLTLRMPRLSDWAVLEPIWTTDRGAHIGGPMSAEDAWLDFNQCVAGWILRGHGALTICDRATGAVLGLVVFGHEYGDPTPELGWLLTEEAEGNGYATEAAAALLPLCRQIYGEGFVSYIGDGNDASVRVAARLGAVRSGSHPLDPTVATYRYPEKGTSDV